MTEQELTLTQKIRNRRVTAEEAMESVDRLINSHFGNPRKARCSIPANVADDDLVASDYVRQSAAEIAALKARVAELGAEHTNDGAVITHHVERIEVLVGLLARYRAEHEQMECSFGYGVAMGEDGKYTSISRDDRCSICKAYDALKAKGEPKP